MAFIGRPSEVADHLISRLQRVAKRFQPGDKKIRSAMLRSALIVEAHAKLNITRKLNKDSEGLLKDRVGHRWENNNTLLVGVFGVPYARIHEFGGTITPKRASSLSIPLDKKFKGLSPRDVSGIFRGKGRVKDILFQKQGDGSVLAAYVLKKSVEIPERPYLGPAIGVARTRQIDIFIQLMRDKLGSD